MKNYQTNKKHKIAVLLGILSMSLGGVGIAIDVAEESSKDKRTSLKQLKNIQESYTSQNVVNFANQIKTHFLKKMEALSTQNAQAKWVVEYDKQGWEHPPWLIIGGHYEYSYPNMAYCNEIIKIFNDNWQRHLEKFEQDGDIDLFHQYLVNLNNELNLDLVDWDAIRDIDKNEEEGFFLKTIIDSIKNSEKFTDEEETNLRIAFNAVWDGLNNKGSIDGITFDELINAFENSIIPIFSSYQNNGGGNILNALKFNHFNDLWKSRVVVNNTDSNDVDLVNFIDKFVSKGNIYVSNNEELKCEFAKLFFFKKEATSIEEFKFVDDGEYGKSVSLLNEVPFSLNFFSEIAPSLLDNGKNILDIQLLKWDYKNDGKLDDENDFEPYTIDFFASQTLHLKMKLEMTFFNNSQDTLQYQPGKYNSQNNHFETYTSSDVKFNNYSMVIFYKKVLYGQYVDAIGFNVFQTVSGYGIFDFEEFRFVNLGLNRQDQIRFIQGLMDINNQIPDDIEDPIATYGGIYCADNFIEKHNNGDFSVDGTSKNIITESADLNKLFCFAFTLNQFAVAYDGLSADAVKNNMLNKHFLNMDWGDNKVLKFEEFNNILKQLGFCLSVEYSNEEIPNDPIKINNHSMLKMPFRLNLSYLDNNVHSYNLLSNIHNVWQSWEPILYFSNNADKIFKLTEEMLTYYDSLKNILEIGVNEEGLTLFQDYVGFNLAYSIIQTATTVTSTVLTLVYSISWNFPGAIAAAKTIVTSAIATTVTWLNYVQQAATGSFYHSQLQWLKDNQTNASNLIQLMDRYKEANVFNKLSIAKEIVQIGPNIVNTIPKPTENHSLALALDVLTKIKLVISAVSALATIDQNKLEAAIKTFKLADNYVTSVNKPTGTIEEVRQNIKLGLDCIMSISTIFDSMTKLTKLISNMVTVLNASDAPLTWAVPCIALAGPALASLLTATDMIFKEILKRHYNV